MGKTGKKKRPTIGRGVEQRYRIWLVLFGSLCCCLWWLSRNGTNVEEARNKDNAVVESVVDRYQGLYSPEEYIYHVKYPRSASSLSYRDRKTCEIPIADPIVVVGSDGSGTRVPSQALARMGVTLLVSSSVAYQMDVDGSSVNLHFTPLINKILCETGGRVDYDLNEFSSGFREDIMRALDPWIVHMESQACAAALRRMGKDRTYDTGRAFTWAFKKPDLLNLLPLLRFYWHNMRVVHVVRDGRDMALSRNEAALGKYSSSVHGVGCDHPSRAHFRALFPWSPLPSPLNPPWIDFPVFIHKPVALRKARLWALQNIGVARYLSLSLRNVGTRKRAPPTPRTRASSTRASLQVRLEDLNDEGRVGVESYASLASFVGSGLRTCDICKLRTQMQSTFMGSHDNRLRGAAKKQYGKWKILTEQNTTLLHEIEDHIGASLLWLGYSLFNDGRGVREAPGSPSRDLCALC